MPHSLAVLIKEQETLVELKHILRKYDCRTYSPSGKEIHSLEKEIEFLLVFFHRSKCREIVAVHHSER